VKRLALVTGIVCFVVGACSSQPDGGADTTSTTSAATTCEPAPDAVCRGANLEGADLSGLSLTGIDLRRANLRGANLAGTDLTQSVLIDADLTGVNLDGARLFRATADGANFSQASVRGTLFTNASLRSASFDGVETSVAIATGANVVDATPANVVANFLDDDVLAGVGATGAVDEADQATAADVVPLLEELTFRVSRDRVAPTKASRRYAYVALAMSVAASPSDALWNEVPDFVLPSELTAGIDRAITAVVAGSIVARELFIIPADDVTIAETGDGLVAAMIGEKSPDMLRASFAHARNIAAAVIARSKSDGFAESGKTQPPVADEPGEWTPTSPNFQPPIDPGWGTLTPFLTTTGSCALPAPPRGADPASPYEANATEVAEVAANLSEEQKAIARFWDDGRGRTGTPSGHWLVVALKLATEKGLPFDQALALVARTTMVMADSFIAVWGEKYKWMVERPITVLQRSNADWSSYLVTPAFPEYPSGHSAVSRAAADVLTEYFGEVRFDDPGYGVTEQSRNQFNVTARSFASPRAAADEASDSRLFGGIHYVMGLEAGKALGSCIAAGVLATDQ
jgi:hypothetical protein